MGAQKRRFHTTKAPPISTLRQISVIDSETIQLSRIGNRPRAFHRGINGVRTFPCPQRVDQTPIFQFFGIKFNFSRLVCYEVSFCENVQRQDIEHSIGYEITEKHRMTSTPVVRTGVYPHMPIADHREIQIVYNTGRHRPCGGMFFTAHTVRDGRTSLSHRSDERRTCYRFLNF